MLRLNQVLPARAHIAGLRIAHAVRLRWWRFSRCAVRGCRALVIDGQGRVLLIRHSYGSGDWMLPGGGLGRGEDPVTGAAREVAEETACRLDPAVWLGRIDAPDSSSETHLVAGWTADDPRADGREIIAAQFFSPAALPAPLTRGLAAGLPEWLRAATAARPPR